MSASLNRQVVLKSRPTGIPQAEHFALVSSPLPAAGPDQVLVRNIFL
ncbi:MAG: NADP-dependent oxidoreductase, partial [Gammaproteobacteria bacterium]